MSSIELSLIVAPLIVIAGLLFYWRLSWWGTGEVEHSTFQRLKTDLSRAFRAPSSSVTNLQTQTFATFFLGGKKVGGELTGNTNWSLCFAFANAIWYFAYLGYTYGIWAFLLQVPWTLAIFVLALLFERYLTASKTGTVHGFIGSLYGPRTAILAAIVTCSGYALNCGFEVFYSAYLLCVIFNLQKFALLISLFAVFFISSCIIAGGYSANVRTNIWKNYVGLFALLLLLGFLTPALPRVSLRSTRATVAPRRRYVGGAQPGKACKQKGRKPEQRAEQARPPWGVSGDQNK
jgi:hypothetical protein